MPLLRNILIFHAGALGDFILTWPLAISLSRLYPQSRIHYITHSQKGRLASQLLGVEWADIESGWHHLHRSPEKLPDLPRHMIQSSHMIISFIANADDPWVQATRQINPHAQVRTHSYQPPPDYPHHATAYLLGQFADAPIIHSAMQHMLQGIAQRGLRFSRSETFHPMVIHPGSGSKTKSWPADHFLELIRNLPPAFGRPRVLLGEVEKEQWPPEQLARFNKISQVVQPTDYVDLFTQLASARLYLGNDSGPSHLAGMLGIPTIALFGPTNPAVWKPLGPNVRTLQADPIDTLSVQTVLHQLQDFNVPSPA